MRRILLTFSATLLLLAMATPVAAKNITFADPNVKAICIANWDTDGDGELSMNEAAAVKDLGAAFSGNTTITSFDELKYFTGLTEIGVSTRISLHDVPLWAHTTGWGLDAPKTNLSTPAWVIGEPTFMPYGDLSVNAFAAFADLSKYDQLVITYSAGTPRVLLNRDVDNGGWNEDESLSHLIDNTRDGWSAKYFTTSGNTLTVDLKQIVADKGFAHLHAIQGAYWSNITVESMVLVKDIDGITADNVQGFYGCTALTSVTIPANVTSLGNYAFSGCNSLTTVTVRMMEPVTIAEQCFTNRTNATLYVSARSKATYETADYWQEFNSVEYENITFADATVKALCVANWDTNSDGELSTNEAAAVKDLGTVFSRNTAITSFDELEYFTGLSFIGSNAFSGCLSLTSVTIPNWVRSIVSYAFSDCRGLTSVTISNSVTSIGDRAFISCSGLTSVTVKNATPISISSDVFPNRASTLLFVPEGSKEAYLAADCWKEFKEIFEGSVSQGVVINGISYDLYDNGFKAIVVANSTTTYSGDIIIPESFTYEGSSYQVTFIGNGAFSGCRDLTSVTLPSSVTSIGGDAFSGCWGMTSVTIPNSVTSIGDNAFYGCNLTSITVESGNTKYDSRNNCNAIIETKTNTLVAGFISTVIPNNVTSIGKYAFSGCNQASVTIPNSVTSIEDYAFSGCNLTSITIPNSVTSIGDGAFRDCKGLTSITIPNSVTSIGDGAFRDCKGLTSITIPNSVTSIGKEAFYGCGSLTSITIPNSVTNIGDDAFHSCSSLTSITIPNSVTSLGSQAFSDCSGLSSVTIPNSVTSIGNGAFYGCSCLTSITIPNSVTSIGGLTFWHCGGLTSVMIPNSVTSIGDFAFYGCYFLKSNFINNSTLTDGNNWGATLVDSYTEDGLLIKDNTIMNCRPWATSVTIPNSVTSIGNHAFRYCPGLTSVTITSSVTSIGDYAFAYLNFLDTIKVMSETPVPITNYVFTNRAKAILYVPAGSKAAYEAADYWNGFGAIVEIVEPTDISALSDAIYINSFKARMGESATMEICLKNAEDATAYFFDLVLPEGITVAKNESGKYIDDLSDRHDDHSRTFNYKGNNIYSLATLSGNSELLTGNDGTIRILTLEVADDMAEGNYVIEIKNASYSTPTGFDIMLPETKALITVEDYILGDVNGNDRIDIGDAVSIVNYLVGKDSTKFVEKATDTNKNGRIDIGDAVTIVNVLVGKATSFSRTTENVWDEREPQ